MSGLLAIVLAAGLGKRMRSSTPKVLHPIAGRPLVHYPIVVALEAGAERVIVVVSEQSRAGVDAHVRTALADKYPGRSITTCVQPSPRGTGDAARIGLEAGETADTVLVLCGDTPLLRTSDVTSLLDALTTTKAALALLSADLEDPSGYGRVIRDRDGRVLSIREDRDLPPADRKTLKETNAGVYAARFAVMKEGILRLDTNNSQGEYYLTDVVAFAASSASAATGTGVVAVKGSGDALVGVNDRVQLAGAERALRGRIVDRHRLGGATILDGASIDDEVVIGEDARIESGVQLRGRTIVGAGASIDVGTVVVDSTIAEGALVKPYCVITKSEVGPRAELGPFAHLRPGSVLEERSHVGNFVELKKTRIRVGAKANHLSYLGDGDIGAGANVGAGTIFCNYDGFAKHQTIIGEGAFIGSDSQIVAPVTIGKGAYVATGTTVTKDVPDDALAIGRTKQDNKLGYASRLKARLGAKKK